MRGLFFKPLKKNKSMKKYFPILFMAMLMLQSNLMAQEDFRKKAPNPGPAPKIELGSAKEVTLKNGLKVIVVENHKLPVFNIQLFVDFPPILEGPSAGYVDLAGQLINKGTTNRTKAEIDEAIDFIGASLSSSPSGITASCLTKHKDQLMDVFTDVLISSRENPSPDSCFWASNI